MIPLIEKMVAVIEAETRLIEDLLVEHRHELTLGLVVCQNPGHCAIGALLYAAGVTNEELSHSKGDPEDEFGWEVKWDRVLWDAYRIDREDAKAIVGANDNYGDDLVEDVEDPDPEPFATRRREVIDTIRALPDRERVAP